MRITPAYELPAHEPSEQDCMNYLATYLQTMRSVPGGPGHTFIELQRNFPLARGPSGRESQVPHESA